MEISVKTFVPHPIDAVFPAMRDQMPAMAEYLPNVASVTVESCTETDGVVELVNRWQAARTEIPAAARAFIDPEKVYWLDHARWEADGFRCHWRLEMAFMPDRIQCQGQTTYHTVDGGTELRIHGDLAISLKGMLPGLVARRAQPKVEAFVVKLIQPNFQTTADAVTAFLNAQ